MGNLAEKKARQKLRKQEKKKSKKEFRIAQQKREQEESGKLIEENHNGLDYSEDYIKRAIESYNKKIFGWVETEVLSERFLFLFRGIREGLQTLVLKWPEILRDKNFYFYVELLDIYRSNRENGELIRKGIEKWYSSICQ